MKKKIIIISSIVAVLAVGGISGAVIYTNSNKDVDTSVNVAENDIDENEVDEIVIDEEDELIEEVTEKEEDTTSDDTKTVEKKTTEEKAVEKNEKKEKTTEKSEKTSDKKETTTTSNQSVSSTASSNVSQSSSTPSQSSSTPSVSATTPATTQAPTTEHVHNYVASTKTIHHDAVTHWEVHNITNTGFDFEANGLNTWGTFTLSDGSTGDVFDYMIDRHDIGCAFGEHNVEVVDSPAWDETVTVYTCECGASYTE